MAGYRASTALLAIGVVSALCGLCAAERQAGGARVEIVPRPLSARQAARPADLRVDTKLVLIPVTVTDPLGAPFSGLPREAFHIFENGVEQRVRYFSTEDAPVSVGVVFDASLSMQNSMNTARAALGRFLNTAVAGDEFFLVEFNDAPRLLCSFTSDPAELETAMRGIQPKGWTALLDAVYIAMHKMKRARNPRKVLLVLSDGADNRSRYTESEMKALLREGDVCIYSIGLGGGILNRHTRVLRKLSEETGGHLWEVDRAADLPAAVEKISAAIRNQYLLGYAPTNTADDGLYRKVQVKLSPPPDAPRLRAAWRVGYYAPE